MTDKKMYQLDFTTIELRVLAAMASKELSNINMLDAMAMNVPPHKVEAARDTLASLAQKVELKLREE